MILYLFISFMEFGLPALRRHHGRVMHRLGLHGNRSSRSSRASAYGIAGHHGLPDDQPQRPTDYHSDNSVHVLQRTVSISATDRYFFASHAVLVMTGLYRGERRRGYSGNPADAPVSGGRNRSS